MPARSERIYLCPGEDGQQGRVLGFPPWWDRSAFFNKYRHREIDLGGTLYDDSALLLMPWEATAWDERCREQFSADARSKEPGVIAEMRALESALSKAKWVIVESYEWESGLD